MSTAKCIRGTLLVCLLLGLSSTYVRAADECPTSDKEKKLFVAIEHRDAKRLATLLAEKRVNINALGPVTGNWYDATATACATPLMYAAWLGDVQTVKLLLANKAGVNLRDSTDRTIWAYAISPHATRLREEIEQRLEITKLLLAAGASLKQADKWSFHETALFHAAHVGVLTGDLRLMKALIAAGAEVNVKGSSILAFTTLAIKRALILKSRDAEEMSKPRAPGATDVMKVLLAAGAKVDQQLDGKTALTYEAQGARLVGALDRIKLLIAAGADVNAQHAESGQTPLLSALKTYDSWLMSIGFQRDRAIELHDQVEVVKFLLASGADANKKDKTGDSALHAAFNFFLYWAGDYPAEVNDLFKSIIASGADPNARDAKGQTIIHLLMTAQGFRQESLPKVDEMRLQLLRLFAAAKADFNIGDNEKTTPLMAAVKNDLKPEVLSALIAAGANPNLADSRGRTPLMEAVVATTFVDDTVKALLAARPAINAQDNDGATALLLAAIVGRHPSFVSLLIAAHADVNLPDKTGQTPLLGAAANENRSGLNTATSADIVQQLINAKADVKARNAANETALMLAIRAQREDIVKLLLDAGVDLNVINNDGDSALTIAARMYGSGRRPYYYHTRPEPLVEQLIKAGARVRTRNKAGETVLTLMSAKAGREEFPIIQLIIERAAQEGREQFVQAEDLLGAIRRAGGKSSAAIVKALIASGADVKARNEEGEAMLIVAIAESGNAEVVESLLAAGADVHVKGANGDTPLLAAIRQYLSGENERVRSVLRQDSRVIELLLAFRANPLDRTRDGLTALDLARQSGNAKLISLIERAQP